MIAHDIVGYAGVKINRWCFRASNDVFDS